MDTLNALQTIAIEVFMPRVTKPKAVQGLFERKQGSGMWSARFTQVDGTGTLRKYVKAFGTDRQAALMWLKLEPGRVRVAEGTRPVQDSAQTVTVAELCDEWLAEVQSKPAQYKDQRNPPYRIGQIKAQFGDRPAASVRPSEIRKWLDSFTDYSPATKNKLKANVSVIYRFGKENDRIDVNPARDVKRDKLKNSGVVRYLLPEEETRLRKVLQSDVDAAAERPRYQKHMIHRLHELTISLGTGMRKGEQYGLRWPDVDLKLRSITIRDTKNGETRVVPMIDDVHASLLAIRKLKLSRKDRSDDKPNEAPDDVVFAIGDNKKWWESALRRAKISNYRWHDNRHTFCSRLAQSGASLKIIQEAAGHKTIQMSARYAHLHQSHLAEAMAVLNRPNS